MSRPGGRRSANPQTMPLWIVVVIVGGALAFCLPFVPLALAPAVAIGIVIGGLGANRSTRRRF